MSELHIQISGEEIVLIRRINCDGQITSAGAEIMVVPPTVSVVQGEVYSATQVVCRCDTDAVHIQLAIEPIVIDQVRIEGELLSMLIPNVDLPIILLLQLPDTESKCVGVALTALARLARGGGALVSFKIGREIAVETHLQAPGFPAEFCG